MKPFNVFPYGSNINFLRLRWVSLAVAALMIFVAIGAIAVKGFNFALDFTGGTSVEMSFKKPVDVDGIRERLETAGYGNAQVQTFGTGNELLIRLQPKTGGEKDSSNTISEVQAAASTPDNPGRVEGGGYVGPQVGRDLAANGVWALLFVVVGFLIYISFRFEKKFAVAAVLTTLHDVVVVAGWFALFGLEFDLTVLAGVLSVMGYSINDTIVVFDRVRENFRTMRADPETILNKSINQTLSRTVITSFVAFLTVLALYLYGGGSLEGMAIAQMLGIVIGTLSSIFVACPLLTMGWLKVTKQDLMPKAKDEAALARRP
ncbi:MULTISPECIES: protein translocase subunit SecF [unclassified Lysobacter]|uniref:protein translocase subunit SecF n=1 Tax=unclassified Lysobacter TaxID=2635362 RepID=UPI0006FE6DB6|nr:MULTISPECIES: protein translocase subunit SecF [unclassified Lysobacter]KRC38395.1 preprotein translocase subunit SecF [Lysobacter sp. Root76]KRD71485.1 preprotein translocase subunit SecF [Lysobacter sp. Root96]